MGSLKFNPKSPVIVVRAKIKGAKFPLAARLALDTGATFTILPWKIVNQLGLSIDPGQTELITTATTIETMPVVFIPEISLLNKTLKRVPCLVKDLPPEAGVDGLLGLSFLHHFKLTLDFKKGILSLK